MKPKHKPTTIPTPFVMPKEYKHVSILYFKNKVMAIIEAAPPNTLWCASSAPRNSAEESKALNWSESVINTIRRDNGQL